MGNQYFAPRVEEVEALLQKHVDSLAQLRRANAKLQAENAALKAENKRLARFTKTCAKQNLPNEMDPEDAIDADYEGAYECIVRDARAALEKE